MANDTYTVSAVLARNDTDNYDFTAPVSGTYTFTTAAAFGSKGILNDLTTKQTYIDVSSGQGKNFLIRKHLNQGDSCDLAVKIFAIDPARRQWGLYTLMINIAQDH